ncbi:hypothetical protein SBOR_5195 [Sclerotinia borealis F-4128]|uniref:Aminoglycoside phosphotransferase domain-containing protein n=1 Tax=Sclerotinia borealis (strain F-4128) TaxID=1432307 RepID=W9CCD3_SCLBF|nr:hypothetical protein SBOR_5195 [Sclerotinia borealis F-4128]
MRPLYSSPKLKDVSAKLFVKSLGRTYVRCFCDGNVEDAVDDDILPKLRKIKSFERNDVQEFFPFIDKLIGEVPSLKKLPLFQGYLVLNVMNVMADEDATMTGIIDWELSPPRPFGVACSAIHYLAGEIIDGVTRQRSAFEEIDRGFWEELISKTPKVAQTKIMDNPEAVQTAFLLGTIFKAIEVAGDQVFISKMSLHQLPLLLRYRIPAIRGSGFAYSGKFEDGITV